MAVLRALSFIVVSISLLVGFLTHYSALTGSVPLLHFGIQPGFTETDVPDLTGKVFVVTGANAGLGKYTAYWLATNGATVEMGCRSMERCEVAVKELREMAKSGSSSRTKAEGMKLICRQVELSSFASVQSFARVLKQEYSEIDSIILNAGMGFVPHKLSEDNIDLAFQVNNFSQYLLVRLLQDKLPRDGPSTIVFVSSHLYTTARGLPKTVEEMNAATRYSANERYGETKLGNIFTANELQKELGGDTSTTFVNSVHPGLVQTTFLQKEEHKESPYRMFYWLNNNIIHPLLAWQPKEASLSIVAPAVAPFASVGYSGLPATRGKYIVPIARLWQTSGLALNETLSSEFHRLSQDIIRPYLE